MAESASTGNSGTGTSTTGTTSTSTSNSGPAAPGSQTSSNGSFSTGNNGNSGKGNNGVGPGLSLGAGVGPNGTLGSLPGLTPGFTGFGPTGIPGALPGSLPGLTPGFTGFASSNFGQGWGSGSDSGSSSTSNTGPVMTVDEVYGKGNQSIVESQGDYEASSNEKSNVETSTFGKQDEISVTPLSVTEDKGLVNNDAIQSVEGLNFQQKDKANQEVMEAKKSRDEAESEDNANGMRNQLKAVAEKDAEETETDAFQVGEETNSKEKAAFIEAEKTYKDIEAKVAEKEAELAKAEEEFNDLDDAWFEVHQPRLNAAKDALNDVIAAATRYNEENGRTDPTYDISYLAEVAANPEDYADAAKVAEQLNDVPGLQGNKYLSNIKQCMTDVARVSKDFYEVSQKHEEAQQRYNQLTYELADLMDSKEKAEAVYNKAKESYGSNFIAAELAQLENEQENNASRLDELSNEAYQLKESLDKEYADYQAKKANAEHLGAIGRNIQAIGKLLDTTPAGVDGPTMVNLAQKSLDNLASKLGVGAVDLPTNNIQEASEAFQAWENGLRQEYFDGLKDFFPNSINAYKAGIDMAHLQRTQEISESLDAMVAEAKTLENRQKELPGLIADAKKKSAPADVTPVEEEAPTVETETTTTETPSYEGIIEATKNEINNSKDLTPEQKAEAISVVDSVKTAAGKMNEAANNLAKNPNDVNAVKQYVEETARYEKTLEDAKGNNALKNTDRNKTFTKAVAAANDFDVTRDDGRVQKYAEFAAEMAAKSPELAKGLYEARAKNHEEKGHKILAAIENVKAKMVMTWLGSKFTFADNQVRNQFHQMAKTDMRATYATYNNVLSDPNATPEDKAEASAAIKQANSLMVVSAALKASTGFFSGIGDSMSDGVYGVTNPDDLNGHQEALNTASNFAKVVLGLGVTPGANEAYQNMYYMAGAKVNESGLFSRDFDGDGFALCQEYGNNAAVGMIAGAGELATGVALMFNPATSKIGINLAIDAVQTFFDGLYGVQKEVNKSIKYSNEVLNYFNEAKSIAAETGNKEAISTMDSAIKQIEDFQLKSDEVGNLDSWLEGSGSNTADNGKFNQALSYDEWLKLIEADPVMQEYAKSLNR